MPEPRKKWSLRRWRRRWNDRLASLSLRWRLWFDRHILSYETRGKWARRFRRRSDKLGRAVESVGFKVIPHQPDADPDSGWRGVAKKFDAFVDERIYPPALRDQHLRAFLKWWPQFTSPFRHANAWVRHAIDDWLMPVLTPAGFHKRLVNWRGLAALLGLIAVVCVVAFLLIPGWRAHNNQKWAAQARLLLGRGYMTMAYQNAVRVWQRDNDNEDAGRVIADMLERQGGVDALYWRRKVVEIAPSITNKLTLAATAIKFEPPPCPTAARIIGEVKSNAVATVQFHVTAAQLYARNNKWPEAEAEYVSALAVEPANPETKLALALTRMRAPDREKISSAELLLTDLSTQTNTTVRALRALTSLAVARSDLDAALNFSKRILSEDGSNFDDRIAHLNVLTRRRDPDREKFLHLLQEQVSSNPFYVAQLAAWMIGNHEGTAALTWLDRLPPAIRRSDPVLLTKADAYAALSDWRGLENFLLKERSWGTIEFLRQTMLARAYHGQGDQQAFRSNFGRASELASGMAARLVNLTRTVSNWGWHQETDDLLWMILERYPKESWAADSLLRLYHERADTDGLRRVYAKQLSRAPGDPYLMNNVAMLSLLRRVELPAAHKLALQAHKAWPDSLANASTYAFSLHVQGKSLEARKILESFGPETLKVSSIASYYAIITHALGDTKTAQQHLELARQAQNLMPEEKAMLEAVKAGR